MRHLWLLMAAVALSSAGQASVAFAQATAMVAFDVDTEVTVSGKPAKQSDQYVYINKAQCGAADGTPITIKMPIRTTGIPDVVEMWVGPGTTDCTVGDNRNKEGGNDPNCKLAATEDDPTQQPAATAKATESFDFDADGKCKDGTYWVYVLALATPSVATGNDNITEKADFRRVHFKVDTTAPTAPTKVSTANGETEATIKWDLPADLDDEPNSDVNIYWDTSEITDAEEECTSALLVPGKAAPTSGVGKKTIGYANDWKPSPSGDLGLKVGQQIPVAVAAVDEAGNAGVLSEVKCVAMENVEGFCEQLAGVDAQGNPKKGCGDDFDTCSATPWRGTGSLWSVLGLSAFALLLARRRRNV